MKIVVSLLLLVKLSRAFSDTSIKDGYDGQGFLPSNKRETHPDVRGGKGIGGVQYLGPIGHFMTTQTAQPHYSKYDLGLTYALNNYLNAYQDQVPYPGVYQHQSKYGPIQYAAPSHPEASYQHPVHMILASYHPNSLHCSKGGGALHYSPAPQFGIFASTAPLSKYSSAPHNSMLQQTQVVHIAAQQQSQPQHQHLIYTGAPTNAQSQHAVLAVQQQQQYVAAPVHQQPQQFHQQQRVVSSHPQPTVVAANPQQYYAAAQPIQATAYHHQQPSYSYSIEPSIQIAASKQIVAPADPTPQYKQTHKPTASYVSLVRQHSTTPTQVAKAEPLAQQVFYPTPSTPIYSSARPLLGPIGQSGPGATPDYPSVGFVQYGTHLNHPRTGKSAAISVSKYT